MTESLPRSYKAWLIASVVVLVLSLGLLAVAVTAAFWSFADLSAPLWVVVMGALSLLGIGLGFGGMFLLLATAGWRSFREGRRVQVLSAERPTTASNDPFA
jgi:protein-S-isoprenylcysteine O-methyltransferase Ste14